MKWISALFYGCVLTKCGNGTGEQNTGDGSLCSGKTPEYAPRREEPITPRALVFYTYDRTGNILTADYAGEQTETNTYNELGDKVE